MEGIFCRAEEGLAAADEVDDFEGVVWLDARIKPERAGEDIEVELDGDAVARHADVIEERCDGEVVGNFTAFAVYRDRHWEVCAEGAFARERMVKRISSFPDSARA